MKFFSGHLYRTGEEDWLCIRADQHQERVFLVAWSPIVDCFGVPRDPDPEDMIGWSGGSELWWMPIRIVGFNGGLVQVEYDQDRECKLSDYQIETFRHVRALSAEDMRGEAA